MDRRHFLTLTGCTGTMTLAGCVSNIQKSMSSSKTHNTSSVPTITVRSTSKYGNILVNAKGMTLYGFAPDKQSESTCYGKCAQMWPPFIDSSPTASSKVKATIGTTKRKDGSKQVVVNKQPVYTFVKDKQPGQAIGQGMDMNGGLWYLLNPAGKEIVPKTITH